MRAYVEDINTNCNLYSYIQGTVPFFSIVDYANTVKAIEKILTKKKRANIKISGSSYVKSYDTLYECIKFKDQQTEIVHAFFYMKDRYEKNKLNSYIILNYEFKESIRKMLSDNKDFHDELCDIVYSKLIEYAPISIDKKWMEHIMQYLIDNHGLFLIPTRRSNCNKYFLAIRLNIDMDVLVNAISDMLRNHVISINNTYDISSESERIEHLDDYLDRYSDLLAYKIKTNFKPKFDPKHDRYNYNLHYFDNYCRTKNFYMYTAQKDVAQAMSNHLEDNDVGFIIGEMGVGR